MGSPIPARARFAVAFSLNRERFHLEDKPCLRITPEIDFLRGEAGSVVMGDFLDDPEMQHAGIKISKSFLDVGLFESMAWARWGAAKWVQNQPRAVAANAYEARVDEGDRLVPSLPFQKFWEMTVLLSPTMLPMLMSMPY